MNPQELKTIAVLQALDDEALARLADVLEERELADGQTVFTEGDPGDGMYFILKGCIHIEKRVQATGTIHKTLAVLEAGDYFGEMALLEQKPRSASAVAAGSARILRLSKAAFDQMEGKSSVTGRSVLLAMIRTSGDRIRRLSKELVVYDEVGKAIGESRDLQTLLDVILQQISSATTAAWGLLLLRSQFSDRLERRGEVNLTLTSTQREAVSNGQGFLEPILQNPVERLVTSFEDEELFKSCTRLGFETASLLLCPITIEGRLLGLIALGGRERGQFDLNGLNLAQGVARQATQAILNARHREEEQARTQHSRKFVRF